MNPIQMTRQLEDVLVDYLMTTFDVNRDGRQPDLADSMRVAFETSGALFNGPFLELAPPYKAGHSLENLIREGLLSSKLLTLDCFKRGKPIPPHIPLYMHQEAAIRKISGEGKSIVVSSGTGSGKTESFLIPILNDLLVDPSPGVRAVLVYPLNALVNDQLDRLRELLANTNITFGRYTSELASTDKIALQTIKDPLENEIISREQIRKHGRVPQILITNYAMLEYLLLRPEDSPLFDKGKWRFVVLDEAHSYSGAKGIEVSMLLRRLKLRLNKGPGEMQCIATSATLINDDPQQAVDFAEHLFGEEFSHDTIIFGETDTQSLLAIAPEDMTHVNASTYSTPPFSTLRQKLNADKVPSVSEIARDLIEAGLAAPNEPPIQDTHTVHSFLYEVLKKNAHLQTLRRWMIEDRQGMPVSVEDAAEMLFSADLSLKADQVQALYHLIELGIQAHHPQSGASLLPVRYHLFARPPQGVWACLNKACQGRVFQESVGWSKIFTAPRETCDSCQCAVYPLTVCRTCGQIYVAGREADRQILADMDHTTTEGKRYFTFASLTVDTSLSEEEDEDGSTPPEDANAAFQSQEITLCLDPKCRRINCQCDATKPRAKLFRVEKQTSSKKGTRSEPIELFERCARCMDKSRVTGTEIVTPISLTGNPPVSVLTSELYRQLPESTETRARHKPGGGRKLLTFYDSRQGAARFAAYMQDVFNQELYRYLVPYAIQEFENDKGRSPSLMGLSEKAVQVGWETLRVFQNDTFLPGDLKPTGDKTLWKQLSQDARDKLLLVVQERLIAEITINRRARQSMETLGLMAVDYFDDTPDFKSLAASIGLTPQQTHLLIRTLLDTLRSAKAIDMPGDVQPNAKIFERNPSHPRVVRSKAGPGEIPWLNPVADKGRHGLIRRVLAHARQPVDVENVQRVMGALWDWLIDAAVLIAEQDVSKGYRLAPYKIILSMPQTDWYQCQRCQRLRYGAGDLPCLHGTCSGTLQPVNLGDVQSRNYFYRVFRREDKDEPVLIPLRIEEHTAQLTPEKGRHYQNAFKEGDINILSCSTTFEMGIDLGDLQAVFLNNVPPTVANYRQRAGRAGRRAGGAAFIVTWAAERPHDQQYFSDPTAIIRGHVRVPYIHLHNVEISRRHINAILLADFLRYCTSVKSTDDLGSLGSFFDMQASSDPSIVFLSQWDTARHASLIEQITGFLKPLGMWHNDGDTHLRHFQQSLGAERQRYEDTIRSYAEMEQKASSTRDYEGAKQYKERAEREKKEQLIDYLSNRGILPSYSFPLSTVELELPYAQQKDQQLRLQRDLRYAIREYAPGAEVVADKRIWVSGGLRFLRDTPLQYFYRLCHKCNHLEMSDKSGVPLQLERCPVCSEAYSVRSDEIYITPDGFRTATPQNDVNKRNGKPAGQYVRATASTMRSALLMASPPTMETIGSFVSCGYSREGTLFYVNEGDDGRGFRVCLRCGTSAHPRNKNTKCSGYYQGSPCGASVAEMVPIRLGHSVKTDTLHLRLVANQDVRILPNNLDFWHTLLYALLHGASRALQIERQDISGLLYPVNTGMNTWEMSLVLYDTVPGGAGHVREIKSNLAKVMREAYTIVSQCDCAPETSCVHCLRDYNNQADYPYLKRDTVIRVLESLCIDLEQGATASQGLLQVSALNRSQWLLERMTEANDHLWIAAERLTEAPFYGRNTTWIDLLRNQLSRGTQVSLLLTQPPLPQTSDPNALSLARHLQTLLSRFDNFAIYHIAQLPQWQIVIDPDSQKQARTIRIENDGFQLTSDNQDVIWTSTMADVVNEKWQTLQTAAKNAKHLTIDVFNAPAHTHVYHLNRMTGKHESTIDPIRRFFDQPVKALYINDPYLVDRERLVNRAGAYINLAKDKGALQSVFIFTRDAAKHEHDKQNDAIKALKSRHEQLKIDVNRKGTEHDRWIDIERTDGTKARMIIGRGLDFIRPDGSVEPTFIVIQDKL